MEEKIKNFKNSGVTVSVLTFAVIPLVTYLVISKILPEVLSPRELVDALPFIAVGIMLLLTILWVKLFKKLD